MGMTMIEIQRKMQQELTRHHVIVRAEGNLLTAEWDGVVVSAGNPFGLDSKLTDIGCPEPRNLYLLEG